MVSDRELVQTVIRGLIRNNSFPAWKMIQDITTGAVPTPLPPGEASGIVMAEVFNSQSINPLMAQQLVLGILNSKPSADQSSGAPVMMLTSIGTQLAGHYLQMADASDASARPQGQSGPYGGGGEMASYETGYPENYGTSPGMSSPGQRPTTQVNGTELPPVEIPETAIPALAGMLWSQQITQAVSTQLQNSPDIDSAMSPLMLASTIPTDSVRQAAFRLFEANYDVGAGSLVAAGFYRDVARDPGQLVVLKALPRVRTRSSSRDSINVVQEADTSQTWTDATQQFVYALRERLEAAANNPALAYTGPQRVRLHRGAVPEAAIAIVLPGPAGSELGAAAPSDTRVFYTRCRVAPTRASEMQDIVEHYEGRTKGTRVEDRAQGILWYDGVKRSGDTIETMDVVIEQTGGGQAPGGQSGGSVNFTIEVIVVITKDPKAASTAPVAVSDRGA
jgi:hypothetical protein